MAHKKDHHSSSSAKKQQASSVSAEDMAQAQEQLADYPQVASALQESADVTQAEAALTTITDLSESAQMALLKLLAKENTAAAANVLVALNTYSPVKEVRKEARRGLIHLEASRTYPNWNPPTAVLAFSNRAFERSSPLEHFWQGLKTDSRDAGEMQLILCWDDEEGEDATMLGFLLEFGHEGVKDFFMHSGKKRKIEEQIASTQSQFTRFGDVNMIACSLEEGTTLIQEALAVNKQFNTKPHADYLRNTAQIGRLIPALVERPALPDFQSFPGFGDLASLFKGLDTLVLQAEDIVGDFLDAWGNEEYDVAYELLANESAIQGGLSAQEWSERRRAWAEQVQPANIDFNVVGATGGPQDAEEFSGVEEELTDEEMVEDAEKLVAQAEAANADLHLPQEVEVFWSLEMVNTPSAQELPEVPMATTVFARGGRHWFWTKYTVVWDEERGERRIQSMTDEWAAVLQLPGSEIESRLNEVAQRIQVLTHELQQAGRDEEELADEEELDLLAAEAEDADLAEAEAETEDMALVEDDEEDAGYLAGLFDETERDETLREIMEQTRRALAYCDALIAQSPSERALYESAQLQAVLVQDWARVAAYLGQIAERFPEERGTALRTMAVMLATVAAEQSEQDQEEEGERLLAQAEAAVRDSIVAEDIALGHIMLAQMLMSSEGSDDDEVARELQRAQALAPSQQDEVLIEQGWGVIAERQTAYQEALRHYLRVAELNPDYPSIWFHIGHMQRVLTEYDEAETNLKRSIEADSEELDAYLDLAVIYTERGEFAQAHAIVDQGLAIDPEAADLLAERALVYIHEGDYRHAREPLEEAEALDPDLEIVQAARTLYAAAKKSQPLKQRKPKSKRR